MITPEILASIMFITTLLLLLFGFPVAFTLAGSALFFAFLGDVLEIFNFKMLFFFPQRIYGVMINEALVAVPLFIFMGVMLEKTNIAGKLLESIGDLFGSIRGGLGIGVVLVGMLLAASTGIVGATVVAMGLISLPAMMKNNYNKSLASGIVCSSGTLGQIIPPSIVLIILADQLATASDAADNMRRIDYKNATGSMNIPGQFSVESVSAGNMFLGAFLPGLVLVSLYMLYVLFVGIFKKNAVPPVKYEGNYNFIFFRKVFLSLVPPLALIFVVLGSILMGVATVNQAGAIGAVGAGVMGSYRLYGDGKLKYVPAIVTIISLIVITILVANFDLNIKTINTSSELTAVLCATLAVFFLILGIIWSFWRTFRINDVLKKVMIETSLTTSMVFIILIGAAMLTAAFRGFGGEEIVKDFLTGLPGGFWTQFIVVMAVIFILGFFLDFIEIAIVVVPIVAPILLAETSANITAVWLGVMIGVNMQTSFLTPPFGFSLFYLRGVAPKSIKTTEIWKGASVFIFLQLVGLGIVGYFPQLVNYLPLRSYYSSEVAPPPINPKLQECLFDYTYDKYTLTFAETNNLITKINSYNLSFIPETQSKKISDMISGIGSSKNLIDEVKISESNFNDYSINYKPLHTKVRRIEKEIYKKLNKIEKIKKEIRLEIDPTEIEKLDSEILDYQDEIEKIKMTIPSNWESENSEFNNILNEYNKTKLKYNKTVDNSFNELMEFIEIFKNLEDLFLIEDSFDKIFNKIEKEDENISDQLKEFEKKFNKFNQVSNIKKPIKNARKLLKKNYDKKSEALELIMESKLIYEKEIFWRLKAKDILLEDFILLSKLGEETFGLRKQDSLNKEQAVYLARCKSSHEDISLYF